MCGPLWSLSPCGRAQSLFLSLSQHKLSVNHQPPSWVLCIQLHLLSHCHIDFFNPWILDINDQYILIYIWRHPKNVAGFIDNTLSIFLDVRAPVLQSWYYAQQHFKGVLKRLRDSKRARRKSIANQQNFLPES